jgi:hypothetical protein
MNTAFGKTGTPTLSDRPGLLRRLAATTLVLASAAAASAKPPTAESAPAKNPASSSTDVREPKAAQPSADAGYRLPGALHKDLSLDDLRRRFGAANVTVAQIDGAEGETFRGIVLFADDPARRAEIFPQDDANLRGIATIRVSGTQSRWQLDNGVHLGMTLAELVAANGKPVSFSGLDWDYGGGISDWHGGRLAPTDSGTVFVAVGLTHGDLGESDSIPLGDSEFRSDDARYPQQGKLLFVGQLTVSFPAPDGR